jgi:Glycosyl transferases group 1
LNRHLHILSSHCPYPPDHGRSIDVFEKIVALHQSDVKIHLHYIHCPHDHDSAELTNYCENVTMYDSQKDMTAAFKYQFSNDDFPVLIEGFSCSQILEPVRPKWRKVVVRLHNVELDTAGPLSAKQGPFHRLLSSYLKKQKKNRALFHKDCLYVCRSEKEAARLRALYHLQNVDFLHPFVAWHEVDCQQGTGNFCLYHGNLSLPANEKTAIWLLEKVFSEIRYPFIIAGKNPSRRIQKLTQLYSHSCIVANPSQSQIDDLIQKAQINIIPSMEAECGKYKLLHSLFRGRHCVTNRNMVNDTGLEKACHIANDSRSKIETIKRLMNVPFSRHEIEMRKELLSGYNNSKNICRLLDWLY